MARGWPRAARTPDGFGPGDVSVNRPPVRRPTRDSGSDRVNDKEKRRMPHAKLSKGDGVLADRVRYLCLYGIWNNGGSNDVAGCEHLLPPQNYE